MALSATDRNWLDDVAIVNESSSLDQPGDVLLFRSVGEACVYIEPWWVEQAEGFAFTATGKRVVLRPGRFTVDVEQIEPFPGGREIVLGWLRSSAANMLAARRIRSRQGKVLLGSNEAEGVLPQSIEGLIAYLGFSR